MTIQFTLLVEPILTIVLSRSMLMSGTKHLSPQRNLSPNGKCLGNRKANGDYRPEGPRNPYETKGHSRMEVQRIRLRPNQKGLCLWSSQGRRKIGGVGKIIRNNQSQRLQKGQRIGTYKQELPSDGRTKGEECTSHEGSMENFTAPKRSAWISNDQRTAPKSI